VGRPPGGAIGLPGGRRVDFMRDIYILNAIWVQGKNIFLAGTLFS
jgi:hypothetical protein